jgi:hypothetical protein
LKYEKYAYFTNGGIYFKGTFVKGTGLGKEECASEEQSS